MKFVALLSFSANIVVCCFTLANFTSCSVIPWLQINLALFCIDPFTAESGFPGTVHSEFTICIFTQLPLAPITPTFPVLFPVFFATDIKKMYKTQNSISFWDGCKCWLEQVWGIFFECVSMPYGSTWNINLTQIMDCYEWIQFCL